MFPDLPGDPPLPETTLVLAGAVFIASILWIVWRLTRGEAYRRAVVVSAAAVGLALLCAATIACRNVGRWADLKRALIAYDTTLRSYSAEHGPIKNEETAEAFYRAY